MKKTLNIYHYLNFIFLILGLLYATQNIGSPKFFFFLGTMGPMALLIIRHHFKVSSNWIVYAAYLLFFFGVLNFFSTSLIWWSIALLIIIRPPATFLTGLMYSFWLFYGSLLIKNYSALGKPAGFLFDFHEEIVFYTFHEWWFLLLLCGYIISVLPIYIEGWGFEPNRFTNVFGSILFLITLGLQLIVGILIGIVYHIKNYWNVFLHTVRKQVTPSPNEQPAFENYWFKKSYQDCLVIFKETYMTNLNSRSSLNQTAVNLYATFRFSLGVIPFVVLQVASWTTVVIGFLLLVIATSIHFIILSLVSIPVLLYYALFKAYDASFLRKNKVATICPSCYHQSLLPTYLCSKCDREHTNLRPGKFGIRKRKCLCSATMPTTTLDNRHLLEAKCQNEDCETSLVTQEATPFSIAIVGAPSSGKTSFITSVIHELQEKTALKNGWSIDFSNPKAQEQLTKQSDALIQGQYPNKTVEKRPLAHNLKITSDEWKNPKLLYIYDPAGEAYESRRELRGHLYLDYIDGYVLMIDPFSLPTVATKYGQVDNHTFTQVKPAATLPEDVYNRLMIHLTTKYQIKENEKLDVPLAIVINKVDAFQLENDIATGASLEGIDDKQLTTHEQCKAFLQHAGYGMLLKQIESKFKTYQLFTASATDFHQVSEERNAHVITWLMDQS